MEQQNYWKKCSVCKAEIGYSSKHYVCSVSTCNQKKTALVFCSTSCFERHLPGARHKDAAAVEEHSPSKSAVMSAEVESAPQRRIIRTSGNVGSSSGVPSGGASSSGQKKAGIPYETLVVVSKLKDYIKAVGDMNTAASCNSAISDIIRTACDRAIENARKDGRKTVMDRDFK